MARTLPPGAGTGECSCYMSASKRGRPRGGRGPRGATRESHGSLGQTVGQRQASAASEQLPSTPWWPLPRASAHAFSRRPPPISLRWRWERPRGAVQIQSARLQQSSPPLPSGRARRESAILDGAKAAAKARSTREKKVLRSATPGPAGRDAYLATAPRPGLMLVRLGDQEARRKAQRLRFQLVHDPVDFLARLAKQDRKAARKSGNVVLAATADTATDFGIAAKIAAAFVGAFFTTPIEFARQGSPRGIQAHRESRRIPHLVVTLDFVEHSAEHVHSLVRRKIDVAVTADLQADLPTLPHLLRTLAQSPSGCVKLLSEA